MTLLLNTSIKVTLIVLVALVATAVLRRRSAAVRHFVLAAALACAAATPALRLVAPAWQAGMGAWLTESRVQLIDRPLLVLDLDDRVAGTACLGLNRHRCRARRRVARWLGIIWAARRGARACSCSSPDWAGSPGWPRVPSASPADRGPASPPRSRATAGLRRPPVLLQSRDAALLATWGFVRAEGDAALGRFGLARGPHPHRPRPRARARAARRLARADGRRSRAIALLVQPARVGGVPPSAARKRAGVRRRRPEDGRGGIDVRHRARRSGQSVQVPAGDVSSRSCHRPFVKPRKESSRHAECPPQQGTHHASGVDRRRRAVRRRRGARCRLRCVGAKLLHGVGIARRSVHSRPAGRHTGALEPAETVEVRDQERSRRGTTSSSACRRATTCSPRSTWGLPP